MHNSPDFFVVFCVKQYDKYINKFIMFSFINIQRYGRKNVEINYRLCKDISIDFCSMIFNPTASANTIAGIGVNGQN